MKKSLVAEDLIEEVARVYGYNNIPNVAPQASLTMRSFSEAELSVQRLRTVLVDRGYQEAITYSFVDPKVQQQLFPQQQALVLPNPISADMSAMRLNLWPGLLQTVQYNQNRQQSRIRLFEYGLKFVPDAQAEGGVRQVAVLGGVILGSMHNEHWNMENRVADFYDLKGDVEALLAQTSAPEAFRFVTAEHSALHPGQTAAVFRGDSLVGLKENIIIGKLIPAGTGMDRYRDFDVDAPDYEPMEYFSSDEADPAAFLAGIQGSLQSESTSSAGEEFGSVFGN